MAAALAALEMEVMALLLGFMAAALAAVKGTPAALPAKEL